MKKLLLSTIIAGVVSNTFAQDTRIDAITQNSRNFSGALLLEDEFLIQLFPSTVFRYGTHASVQSLNIGNNIFGNFGYASAMYVKNNFAIGTYINRPLNLGGPIGVIRPVEALLAYRIGDLSIGATISIFSTSTKDTNAVNPNNFNFITIGIQPSVSYQLSETSGIDISIPLILGNGSDRTGTVTNSELESVAAMLSGRFYSQKFILPFAVGNANISTEIPSIPQTIENGNNIIFLGAGRTHELKNNHLLVYGLNLNATTQSSSVTTANNTVEATESEMNIGLLLGGEFNLMKNKLKARGSLSYNIFNSQRSNQVVNQIGLPGAAALGLGYDTRHFRVDAAVSTELLNNGFFFITGNNSALFPRITLLGRL